MRGLHRPEDVVVLLRALGDLPVYERALEDQGLLTMSVGGRGYWGRQVVRDLCAWLAALANPRDEIALYGVLASPLVGLSSDALAHVARAGGKGNAWRAIEQDDGALRERLADDDRERLDVFATRFAAERALAPRLALDELLRRVVDATGYDLHVLSLAGGERRLANVHKLLRLAAAFERDRGRDVRGLADLATAELEAEARETDAPVELGDVKAVRLMSIHAAKGLEFPVVCVVDLGRQRPGDGDEDLLVAEGEVGLRLVGLDGTSERALAYERLRDRARERAAREEERVMYVALTRAQERLIVSGGVTVDTWPQEGPKSPPLAWLGRRAAGRRPARPADDDEPLQDVEIAAGASGPRRAQPARDGRPRAARRVARAGRGEPAGRGAAGPAPAASPSPPAAPEPVRTLSYSRLSAWKQCGYRFYLQRVLGLPDEQPPTPPRPRRRAFDPRTRGSLVHAAARARRRGPRADRRGLGDRAQRGRARRRAAPGRRLRRLAAGPAHGARSHGASRARLHRRARRHAADGHRRRARRTSAAAGSSSSTTRPTRVDAGHRPRRVRRGALRHPAARLRARRRCAAAPPASRSRTRSSSARASRSPRVRGRRRRPPGAPSCWRSPAGCSPANTRSRRRRTASCARPARDAARCARTTRSETLRPRADL